MEHTPGPWEAEGGASDAPDPRWQIFTESLILAVTCGGNDQANARLIAAAPELLDACKTAKHWILGVLQDVAAETYSDDIYDDLDAAITKATV